MCRMLFTWLVIQCVAASVLVNWASVDASASSSRTHAGLDSKDEHNDEPHSAKRARRSPASVFGWSNGGGSRYSARATRTFSSDEIDAFNQGLHRKRPKFIGKRQAIDNSVDDLTKQRGTTVWNDATADADGAAFRAALDKRSPPRKFMGRRSGIFDETFDGQSNDISKRNQPPRRKFVGKRPANRKFVGKRFGSEWHEDDDAQTDSSFDERLRCGAEPASNGAVEGWLSRDDKLIVGDQSPSSASEHVTESKRATRKFVG